MKRKRKLPAARNPFVALALKRKAGAHRKTAKAMRRAEKVNLQGDVARRSSGRLLTDCRGSIPFVPTRALSKARMAFENVCPGGVTVAALVLETSAFGRVGSNPTWGTSDFHMQIAEWSKASDCKSDGEAPREFKSRSAFHLQCQPL